MKKWIAIGLLFLLALSLAACGAKGKAQSESTSAASSSSSALKQDYENALPAVGQLMVGIFRLEDTEQAVTAEQAKALLPLWKAYRSMSGSDSASAAELESLVEDIEATLTSGQIKAIAAMKLTRQDMIAVMQEQGIEMPRGQIGKLSEEQITSLRATRQASGGGGGFPAGGGPPPGDFAGGAPPGGQAMDPERLATLRAQGGGRMGGFLTQSPLYDALIKLLESKV